MGKTLKIKIGEFARLGQVTVQTLRYYAELDLLRPGEVDPFTGYRFYLLDQLPSLHRILVLKDMGIPLEQIKRMLYENISIEEMRRILLIKQDDIRTQVQNSLDQLERIDIRLQMLEHAGESSEYEINIKRVDALPVVSVTGEVPNYWDVSPLWMELRELIQRESIRSSSPYLTLCHATEPKIKLEVCAPLASPQESAPAELMHVLPEVKTMVFTIHRGSYSGLIDGYTALWQWVENNGFKIIGPDREIYLRLPEDGRTYTDPNSLTELQIPVVPA
jgi:DNA-binding transcriptional MerR regulator/effector-binding domain-containing protein